MTTYQQIILGIALFVVAPVALGLVAYLINSEVKYRAWVKYADAEANRMWSESGGDNF